MVVCVSVSVPLGIPPSVRSYTQFIWGGAIVGQLREFLERLVFPKGSMHIPLLLPYTDEIHCTWGTCDTATHALASLLLL